LRHGNGWLDAETLQPVESPPLIGVTRRPILSRMKLLEVQAECFSAGSSSAIARHAAPSRSLITDRF